MITIELDPDLRAEIDGPDLAYCTPYGNGASLSRRGTRYTLPGRAEWQWAKIPIDITAEQCLIEIPALGYSETMYFNEPSVRLNAGDTLEIFADLEAVI